MMLQNSIRSSISKKNLTSSKVLLLIVLLACILRLKNLTFPLADWHSFRQADTASVTREYVKHGIDLLRPRYHDLSDIQAGVNNEGRDNVEGWRMVEFPFINGFLAFILKLFPFLPLVPTSRVFSIFASIGTLLSIYYFAKLYFDEVTSLLSALTFAVLPYAVYYSRVILPEPYMVFFSTLSLLTFTLWLKKSSYTSLIISACSLSLALLLKPFVVFLAPIFLTIFILENMPHLKKNVRKIVQNVTLLIPFGVVALVPLLLWRNWILQFPTGIPVSDWLFNSNNIRFRPAWFRWLGYERLTKIFLGYAGVLFLPFAFTYNDQWSMDNGPLLKKILSIINHPSLIMYSWWLGILAFFSVIATGNVQHDYYQNLMIPILCITIGVGVKKLYEFLNSLKLGNWNVYSITLPLFIVSFLYVSMLYFSWQQVKGFFNVNHWEYVEAGQVVDRITPADAKIIAPAQGDTIFLFQTNRTGWPIGFNIDKKISEGANYYVTTTYDDEARELEAKYETVEKTEKYLILKLQ